MKLTITLVLETENEENALTVVSRLNKLISAGSPALEKYHKGGPKVLLEKDLMETHWPNAYLAGLSVAQSFGRFWTVLGYAHDELSLVGNEFLNRPLFPGDPEVRIQGYGKEELWKQIFT